MAGASFMDRLEADRPVVVVVVVVASMQDR